MAVEFPELVAETPYVWRASRGGAHRHRLICFPHAGAGAGAYAEWAGLLPPEIELAAVQLPGRQNRIAEDPVTEVGPLVRVLTQALRPVLDGSFSFFGHSGGAVLAFELARALQDRGGPRPRHLFLSAQPAPGSGGRVRVLHDLTDEELTAEVVRLGGIEPEIAEDEDVMASLLPTLRADFDLWEHHRIVPGPRLRSPITVFGGTDDPRAPLDTLDGWREQTDGAFTSRFFPGGHFYFLGRAAELIDHMSRAVLEPETAGAVA
ncbi:thioesterase domain-containing protein [Streptomyces sp. 15-116A]|uniref:thioesterase II family protein n=1 Tax=Streptomyces sp. 15-116A TaxID=2259035 RepID=UPI0021B2E168|nr:thioesterase domain-containing protein [Streptomyces sp. 15-116A]MCT7357367.1 thioesterase domain-containing protein [Streptomyces sp. 15-116A]